MVYVWLECFSFLRFSHYIWLFDAFWFFARPLEVGRECILLFHVSVAELNFSPLKQIKMRADLAWKWYSGSRYIPGDCLSGHLLKNWSVQKAKTGSRSEFPLRKMVSVRRQTGRQGVPALKDSPGPEWRKSLSITYRPPRASRAEVDSWEHASKGFTSQFTELHWII